MDEDLEDILDSALDEFEPINSLNKTDEIPTNVQEQNQCNENFSESKSVSDMKSSVETPTKNSIDQQKVLEDALKSLKNLDSKLGSNSSTGAASSSSSSEDAQLNQLMQLISTQFNMPEFNAGENVTSNDDESMGDIDKLVEGMVGQLLSQQVLKQPMIEMQQQYHEYLSQDPNISLISQEDRIRYEKQSKIVDEIVMEYESETPEINKITTLLQSMQEFGLPPPHIAEELDTSDSSLSNISGNNSQSRREGSTSASQMEEFEALEKLSEQCATQ
mmetsp:Transcript_6670/g.11909  ORF Transcript_6670/g.11909 Transcript_6670/m.11909 type:complete len:275 (-) Transcript_6670:801-1625(-)